MSAVDFTRPIRLRATRAWRTYTGGRMISALHGKDEPDTSFPEEWLMSAVRARNAGREDIVEGLTLVDGTDLTLADLLREHPVEMLGEKHYKAHGASLAVLVKLLDSAERLRSQVHPTRETARKLFNSPFGKTECWHIIGTRVIGGEEPCIYLGFTEDITREKWVDCFEKQDIPRMISYLHRFPVKVGDTFIIHGGVPHAIGAGCFLIEIQEPTDFTISTELTTPSGLKVAPQMCHQGIGFERMFECFNYEPLTAEETLRRWRVEPETRMEDGVTVTSVIGPRTTDMFAFDLLTVPSRGVLRTHGRFSGLYVLEGSGTLDGQPLAKCDHFFLSAGCRDIEVTAVEPLKIIRCYGPKE